MIILSALRYHLRIFRVEQLALPAGLWALFALMLVLFRHESRRPYDLATSFLGIVVPLMAGILSAPAIVEDPALELQFSAPRPAWRLLVERLALVLAIAGVAAVSFQLYSAAAGVSLDGLGNLLRRQLAWIVPCLALSGLSTVAALGTRHATGGALLVGLVWIIQTIMRESISATSWGRYVYLYMGARQPGHPSLVANQATLTAIAAALVAIGVLLLRREERYL